MIQPLLKPWQIEGRVRLTKAQERKKLDALCASQNMLCAECGQPMTREQGHFRTATLDHITPQPAGCFKDGSDSNLRAICWIENYLKGSKRQ